MNNNIKELGLQPADRIVVPKSLWNIVQHHAIYLGVDHNQVHWFIENKEGIGVRCITANQFFSEVNSITRIEKFSGNDYERKKAVQRALVKSGKPYNLIDYNCEHFANEVQLGIPWSSQVGVGIFVLLIVATFILSSDS